MLPFLLLVALGCGGRSDRPSIKIKGETFFLETARDPESQARGLMFRDQLGEREGMIFVFPDEATRRFWMKNTWIPLTILFVKADGIVTDMLAMKAEEIPRPDEQYPTYPSSAPVKYALEFRQGVVEGLGLKTGEKLDLAGF